MKPTIENPFRRRGRDGARILHMSLKSISIPTTCGFDTPGELKLPFVTRGEFIIPTPPPEGIAAMSVQQ